MPERVEIFEVGPRDGLQNEKRWIPTAEKITLVNTLSRAGFRRIEVASFVSPKWVPQMADGGDVLAGIERVKGVSYAALTPNMKGFKRAMQAQADEIAIFASASEGFSHANLNCSVSESLDRLASVAEAAKAASIKMRGYISCVTDCPFDGPTPPHKVAEVARTLKAMGCYEVSLGDTIGKGTPETVGAMLETVLTDIPAAGLAGHYHDTNGCALQNISASLNLGLQVFDAAVGGLGGCPYAPGAQGNVATEAVLTHLAAMGFETGVDAAAVAAAGKMAQAMRTGG